MNLTLPVTLTPVDIEAFITEGPKGLASFPVSKPGEKKVITISFGSLLFWLVVISFAVLIFMVQREDAAHPTHLVAVPTEPPIAAKATGIILVTSIVIGIAYVIISAFSKKSRAKATWENTPDLRQPQTFIITPEDITIRSPTAESRCTWLHFTHFYEGPSLLLLYNSSKAAHILPKRAFPTPADAAAFADYCRSKISTSPTAFPVLLNNPPPSL